MDAEVIAAMAEANEFFVDMHELLEAAGERIAERLGTEAALVTAGLVGLTFGFVEAPIRGWSDPAVYGSLAGGALVLIAFDPSTPTVVVSESIS